MNSHCTPNTQVKFKNELLPKLLPLNDFVPEKESYFSRFETCTSGATFIDLWKEVVKPYLDKENGRFQPPTNEDTTPSPSFITQIPKKRKSSTTPPAIQLATKVARQQLVTSSACDDCDEEMDKQIQKNFLGMYHYNAGRS